MHFRFFAACAACVALLVSGAMAQGRGDVAVEQGVRVMFGLLTPAQQVEYRSARLEIKNFGFYKGGVEVDLTPAQLDSVHRIERACSLRAVSGLLEGELSSRDDVISDVVACVRNNLAEDPATKGLSYLR